MESMEIEKAKSLCKEKKLHWTEHVFKRLLMRNITTGEVIQAILSGEIIENYHDDYPYPSCLMLGWSENGRPLHVVCAENPDDGMLWLITAYEPDAAKWENSLKTRKDG